MLHHAHKARLRSSIVPKNLVDIWHSQQSTDSEMMPTENSVGLQMPTLNPGATPEAML